jgi:hypothetical protein
VKTALLRGRRPTLAPDWIGFLAFRESFELHLGAIPTPTLFLLGARAGTNAKGRFCKARTNLCCGSIEPLSSGEPNVVFRERLKAHLQGLVNPKIGEHRGRIVKNTGDAFLAEFASVVDAVRCAVEIQRAMAERNEGTRPATRIEFRTGINLDDVIVEEHAILGDGVNVAALLEAIAEPGGICISRMVRDNVRDKLDYTFEDLGEQQVKNIARPVRVYRVRDRTVPIEHPLWASSEPLLLPDKRWFHSSVRLRPCHARRRPLRPMARIRPRRHNAFLCAATTRGRLDQVEPQKIIADGTDWRFLNELKRELKA